MQDAGIEFPTFPDWVVDEDMIDEVLFEDELFEDVEEEEEGGVVEKEKKRKRGYVRKESMKEIKKGKRPIGVEGEEEEDMLEIDSGESLSEGEKQENIEMLNELSKESEEEYPTSKEEDDEFQDAGDKLDDAADVEGDSMPHANEPVNEPIPENQPQGIPQLENTTPYKVNQPKRTQKKSTCKC